MNELIKLGKKTYYIKGFTNIGIYVLDNNEVCLIDCGLSNMGPIILDILKENNWKLKYIINTHSHADHTGSNNYLLQNTNAKLIASKIERVFLRNSKLDIGFLYGGYPLDEYDNKLMHIEEQREILPLASLPDGIRSKKLPGHHYDMFGLMTDDNVFFVADAISSKRLIDKEHIMLIYNVEGYFKSLDNILSYEGTIVPAHDNPTDDFYDLVIYNRDKAIEIINVIKEILVTSKTLEEVVSLVFDHYRLKISYNKYLLITSTIRSYIAYLNNKKELTTTFKDNKMYFTLKKESDI